MRKKRREEDRIAPSDSEHRPAAVDASHKEKASPRPASVGPSHASRGDPKSELGIGLAGVGGLLLFTAIIFIATPWLVASLGQWSYLGAFLLSLLASASIFIPTAPLQIAIFSMGRSLDPMVLGLVAGLGSGLGELSGFFLGHSSAHLLKTEDKTYGWLLRVQTDLLKRWTGPGVFLLSAIFNPFFDFAGIVAGLMGMKWYEFLLWCIAGRVVRFALLAYLGGIELGGF